jgi:hypothetical protein
LWFTFSKTHPLYYLLTLVDTLNLIEFFSFMNIFKQKEHKMKALVYLTATALMGVFFEASAQHTQPSGQHLNTENGFVLEVKNPEAKKLKMVIRGNSGAAVYKRNLGGRVHYAGRDASASPATGLAARHKQQQEALIAQALGFDTRKPD